jgi:hypothetical protein
MAAPQFILWDSLWFGTRRRNYKIRRIRGRKEFKKKPGILPQRTQRISGFDQLLLRASMPLW